MVKTQREKWTRFLEKVFCTYTHRWTNNNKNIFWPSWTCDQCKSDDLSAHQSSLSISLCRKRERVSARSIYTLFKENLRCRSVHF